MNNKLAMALLFVAVMVVWAAFGCAPMLLYEEPADRAFFGDMFGAVGALFSGLAFAGLIVALQLQRQELALQRDELAATREELKRSASAQEATEKALQEQVEIARTAAIASSARELYAYYDTIARGMEVLRGSVEMEKFDKVNNAKEAALAQMQEAYALLASKANGLARPAGVADEGARNG